MISDYYPGHLILEVKGKKVEIWGDSCYPANKLVFYTSLQKVTTWIDGTPITDSDKEKIKATLLENCSLKGWILEWV
jgi:hypothetical protein